MTALTFALCADWLWQCRAQLSCVCDGRCARAELAAIVSSQPTAVHAAWLVDKPCTIIRAETGDLLALEQAQGRVLTVYQSRSFDADFLSLKQVMEQGQLARLVQFESRFDRFKPRDLDRWRDNDMPGAALWLDLDSQLLDQCLVLLGMPDALRQSSARPARRAARGFFGARRQPAVSSAWHAGLFQQARHGHSGDALKTGHRPHPSALTDWGLDPKPGGVITMEGGQRLRPAAATRSFLCAVARLLGGQRRFTRLGAEFLIRDRIRKLPISID